MPAAASKVVATPKKRNGVIAAKRFPIQLRKPSCGLNSSALMMAEATPMKMKVRMKRGVRKVCMLKVSRSAGWARAPDHFDDCRAIDGQHSCRGRVRDRQPGRLAVGGEQVDAPSLG